MAKKAIIILELGYESAQASNSQIEKDIRAEAQIPWCTKINKIEVYNP
ncbi:hypothetical protein IMZ68_00080 [Candidatus Bathyarchaeota archaeon]|nr:hypothetical protein [Candidatus Bathyarchaeota archaeon]